VESRNVSGDAGDVWRRRNSDATNWRAQSSPVVGDAGDSRGVRDVQGCDVRA